MYLFFFREKSSSPPPRDPSPSESRILGDPPEYRRQFGPGSLDTGQIRFEDSSDHRYNGDENRLGAGDVRFGGGDTRYEDNSENWFGGDENRLRSGENRFGGEENRSGLGVGDVRFGDNRFGSSDSVGRQLPWASTASARSSGFMEQLPATLRIREGNTPEEEEEEILCIQENTLYNPGRNKILCRHPYVDRHFT